MVSSRAGTLLAELISYVGAISVEEWKVRRPSISTSDIGILRMSCHTPLDMLLQTGQQPQPQLIYIKVSG